MENILTAMATTESFFSRNRIYKCHVFIMNSMADILRLLITKIIGKKTWNLQNRYTIYTEYISL